MKSVCLLLLVAAACQQGESSSGQAQPPPPPGSDAYAKDIASLCDCMKLSGADKEDEEGRQLIIANWLAANLKTAESRRFLVQIQPLAPEPKATALDTEARRVGLSGCALAAEWRNLPPPSAN